MGHKCIDQVLLKTDRLNYSVAAQRLCRSILLKVAVTCVQRSSGLVLEQAARGDCERSIHADIQVTTGRTVAVPLPKGSPLTCPPILPPELVNRITSHPYVITVIKLIKLSIVVFTDH